jgi:hypothetical protein
MTLNDDFDKMLAMRDADFAALDQAEALDALLRLRNTVPASSGGPLLEIGLSLDAILDRLAGPLPPSRICSACGSRYPMDQSCGCFDNGSE